LPDLPVGIIGATGKLFQVSDAAILALELSGLKFSNK